MSKSFDLPQRTVVRAAYFGEILPGDVILFRGRGLLGWALRVAAEGPYTHAAIVESVRERNVVIIAESREGAGSRMVSLENQLLPGDTADVFRVMGRTDESVAKAVSWAVFNTGRPYGWGSVKAAFLRKAFLLRWLVTTPDDPADWPDTGRRHCSEFVARAFDCAELPLVGKIPRQLVNPGSLAQSARLFQVCRLRGCQQGLK